MDICKYRTIQYLIIILIISALAGGYFYFHSNAAQKINSSKVNNLTSGLVGYWTFDGADMSVTYATNKASVGQNGALNGTSGTIGKIGQAAVFDGSSGYISVADTGGYYDFGTGDFSISAWIKTSSASGNIIWKLDSTNDVGYQFAISGSHLLLSVRNGPNVMSNGLNNVSDGNWHHVVAVADRDLIGQLYVDGVYDEGSGSIAGSSGLSISNNTNYYIGTRFDAPSTYSNYFNGSMDEVRAYNRALTQSEITELYQQGQTKINASQTTKLTNGLVLYQSFDGNNMDWSQTTAEARDQSGNNYHGDVQNISGGSAGKIGQSLTFNGSSSAVDMGNASALNFNYNNTFSTSAWVKKTSSGGLYTYISKWVASGTGWLVRFNSDDTIELRLQYADVTRRAVKTTSAYNSNSDWYHVVTTSDGVNASGIKIYVNGSLVSTTTVEDTINNNITNAQSAVIGKRTDNNMYFPGQIDEVRVYNRVLSANEITELYQEGQTKINASQVNKLTSGLVGYWTMDGNNTTWTGASTGTVADSSGNGYTGTLTNMSRSTTPAVGKIGQALDFNTTGYVNLGNASALNFAKNNPFSASLWLKKSSTGSYRAVLSKWNETITRGWNIRSSWNDDKFCLFFIDDAANSISVKTNSAYSSTADWYHLVTTYDGTNSPNGMKIYVNGAEVATTPSGTSLTGTMVHTDPAMIGARFAGGNVFNGKIDEVRIYNRALSASEVTELYNQGL